MVAAHAIVDFLGPDGAGESTATRLPLGPARGVGTTLRLDIARGRLATHRRVG